MPTESAQKRAAITWTRTTGTTAATTSGDACCKLYADKPRLQPATSICVYIERRRTAFSCYDAGIWLSRSFIIGGVFPNRVSFHYRRRFLHPGVLHSTGAFHPNAAFWRRLCHDDASILWRAGAADSSSFGASSILAHTGSPTDWRSSIRRITHRHSARIFADWS